MSCGAPSRVEDDDATQLERRADLDRRLSEMIERYRELNAKKRAAGS